MTMLADQELEGLRDICPEPWALSLYVPDGVRSTYIKAQNGGYTVIVPDAGSLARAVDAYDKEFGLPVWKGKDWRVTP